MRVYPIALMLVGLSLVACGDPPGPSTEIPDDPSVAPDDPSPGTPDSRTGGVRVMAATSGLDIDLDGFRVLVDGQDQGIIGGTGSKEIGGLATGSRTISLAGLASNCAVDGPGPRTVTIVAKAIVPVAFTVVCTATRPEPPLGTAILAFSSLGDIYVADLDGSHLGRLTTDGSPYSYNLGPVWSPDARRIAFTKLDGSWGAAIYVIDPDATNPTRLSPGGTYDADPSWSPDGSRVAFENRADNTSGGQIWIMNADGTNRVQLTSNRQPTYSPAWSPDGQWIAYSTYPDPGDGDGDVGVFVMAADGANPVHLTQGNGPHWLPHGKRIVFSRGRDLYVVNRDGKDVAPLFPGIDLSGSGSLVWSPDGRMIAFGRATDCHTDPYGDPACHHGIWIMHADGSQLHELLLPVLLPGGPSWRP